MFNVRLAEKSRNKKTGPIPVSTSSAKTCPDSCPLKGNGCYADGYPLRGRWQEVTEGRAGDQWDIFLSKVAALPENQLWRHNQAGDLPGKADKLDHEACINLAKANAGKRGFTYTHYPVADNLETFKAMNALGFTVNLSGNNLDHADSLADTGLPVVTLLPADSGATVTPKGRKVAICPAIASDDITCASCQLCQRANRKVIVGFPAHGNAKKKATAIATA